MKTEKVQRTNVLVKTPNNNISTRNLATRTERDQ